MMSLLFVVIGALCGAIYTYILRRNSQTPASAQKFVFWVFFFSLISALIYAGERLSIITWSVIVLGSVAGLFVTAIFYALPRAFEKGPTNLSIGIFQAACILPPLLMAIIFGCDCGFKYTLFHGLGALLVIAGFLKSSLKNHGQKLSLSWLFYTGIAFLSQTVALTIYQYQALLTKENLPPHALLLSVTTIEATTGWFLPTLFGVVLIWNFISLKGKIFKNALIIRDGAFGGLCNAGSVAFFMLALTMATPLLVTLIVPINAVLTIAFCNVWSQLLYKEKVDWIGMGIALSGILLSFL